MEKYIEEICETISQTFSKQPSTNQPAKKSQFLPEYNSFFQQHTQFSTNTYSILQLHFANSIDVKIDDQDAYVKIKLITHTSNYQIMRFSVQLKYFITEIVVLNCEKQSEMHKLHNVSDAAASVYLSNDTAIKCIHINNKSFMESFFNALKEYIILKISSVLKIGPKMSNILGFDLVIYEHCIEFCMERCWPITTINQMQMSQLKLKLRKLHQLQIVHLDIKPSNICHSPSLNELVFIDFGFSDILKQRVGEKTSSVFVGSLSYCSPEMLKCYCSPIESSLVDLYYNDVYSLSRTFTDLMKSNLNIKSAQLQQIERLSVQYLHINIESIILEKLIKYTIFQQSPEIFSNKLFHLYIRNHPHQVLNFCRSLPESFYMETIRKQLSKDNHDILVKPNYEKNEMNFNFYHDKISQINSERNSMYFIPMESEVKIERQVLSRHKFIMEALNLKEILFKKELIQNIDMDVYLKSIVIFINFQAMLSNFKQKRQVCALMNAMVCLEWADEDEFSVIIAALRYLMTYYLNSEKQYCVDTIPIILCNLVILQAISQQQLIDFLRRIIRKDLRDSKYGALMILRCSFILVWIASLVDCKYQTCELFQAVDSLITQQFTSLIENSKHSNRSILQMFLKIYIINKRIPNHTHLIDEACFSGSYLKRQLYIYYLLGMFKGYMYQSDYEAMPKYLKIIKQKLEENDGVYTLKFISQIGFSIFYFKTRNIKMIDELFKNMQERLNHPKLVQKFRLHSYFHALKFRSEKQNPYYYQLLLKQLESKPQKSEKQLLQYVSFIYEPLYSNTAIKFNEDKQKVYGYLRSRIPLSIIDDFQQFYRKFKSNHCFFFRFCLNIVSVLYQIYKNAQISIKFGKFRLKIEQFASSISCVTCHEIAEKNILMIDAYLLHQEKKYEQIIKLYNEYIDKATVTKGNDKIYYLLEMIKYSLWVPNYAEKIEEPIQRFYEAVSKDNLWKEFFFFPKALTAFQAIQKYFFLFDKLEEFIPVHIKLLEHLNLFQSNQYILSFSTSLIELIISLNSYHTFKQKLFEQIRKFSLTSFKDNCYTTLIFSIFLIGVPLKDGGFRGKIIRFICNNIYGLSAFSKQIVLGHLFYYLIMRKSQYQRRHESIGLLPRRLVRYFYKNYLKYAISYEKLKAFLYNFSKNRNIASHTNAHIKNGLMAHLKRYYYNLELRASSFSEIRKYYQSPIYK